MVLRDWFLHSEHTKILNRMDNLTDLFLDGDMDKKTYEAKRDQLAGKRDKILVEIESHTRADDNFAETLVRLIELACGALEKFKGSTTEEKRALINLVFANLKLKGHKLVYTLRPPFDMFVNLGKNGEWRTRKESNL